MILFFNNTPVPKSKINISENFFKLTEKNLNFIQKDKIIIKDIIIPSPYLNVGNFKNQIIDRNDSKIINKLINFFWLKFISILTDNLINITIRKKINSLSIMIRKWLFNHVESQLKLEI